MPSDSGATTSLWMEIGQPGYAPLALQTFAGSTLRRGVKVALAPALLFPRQGQIHPLLYLKGLADAVIRYGGIIHCATLVIDVEDGRPTRVKTPGAHIVSATATVVATNTPVNNRFFMHTEQAAYRTFVVGLRVSKGSVPWNPWWDMLDRYRYVRVAHALDADHYLLIVGGEDHKTGQADDADVRFDRLAAWAAERFPVLGAPVFQWSGQVMQPADGLAFIGRNPGDNHVFIVTGDSGNGMTHGTIVGRLLGDLVLGRENAWAEAYHPSRNRSRPSVRSRRRTPVRSPSMRTGSRRGRRPGFRKSSRTKVPSCAAVFTSSPFTAIETVLRALSTQRVHIWAASSNGNLRRRPAVRVFIGSCASWSGHAATLTTIPGRFPTQSVPLLAVEPLSLSPAGHRRQTGRDRDPATLYAHQELS